MSTATSTLNANQLAQRIDELTGMKEHVNSEYLEKRLFELNKLFAEKTKNTFNKGVVNPLPPENVDTENPAVITPKPPMQVEREYEDWARSLND